MSIYGELGCYPLSIIIKQRMVCYWTRILKSNEDKLNKVIYAIWYNLHNKTVHLSPWIKCVSKCFENNGFNYIWMIQDHNIDAKIVYICEWDQIKQFWQNKISYDINDNKMYKLFKYSHGKESYTKTLPEHLTKHYSNLE